MNTGDEVGGGEVAKARRLRRPPPCCGSDLRSVNRLDVSGVILSSFKNRFLAKAVLALKCDDIVTGDIHLNNSPSASERKWS